LRRHNRTESEAAFRDVFVVLADELLSKIQLLLTTNPAAAARSFAYVRRYYVTALEGPLALQSAVYSRHATASLEAMSRALDELNSGRASAAGWFVRERQSFMQAVRGAPGASVSIVPL
jgi:hypothetical protein